MAAHWGDRAWSGRLSCAGSGCCFHLLDYAGNFTLPGLSNSPGESFVDLLLYPEKRNSRKSRTIYGEYGQTRYARINSTMKFVTRFTGQLELYDLVNDANETINLLQSFLPLPHSTMEMLVCMIEL